MDVRRCLRPSFQFSRTGSIVDEIGRAQSAIVSKRNWWRSGLDRGLAYLLLPVRCLPGSDDSPPSRQVLRTFIFCKTSSIFVDDLDDTIEARKRASHKEIGIVGKKVVARARTKIDRTVGPPLSKNCAFHQRTTDLFSFLAEKKEDN